MLDELTINPVVPRSMRRAAEMTTGERAAWEAGVMQASALMESRAGRISGSQEALAEAASSAVLLRHMAQQGPTALSDVFFPT